MMEPKGIHTLNIIFERANENDDASLWALIHCLQSHNFTANETFDGTAGLTLVVKETNG